MPITRKLAAIMFTDIAGYTALMQKSEQAAVDLRKRHRAIFERNTEKFQGRIIQYYGDGTLSIFESTVSAVECGIALQKEFLAEPHIPVRIGIHTGDILISETDIIGDSVNLASRVESMGVPGSVVVSGKVAEEIKNQENLPLKHLGSFQFKNDHRKRDVYALIGEGLVVPDKKDMHGKLRKPKPSLVRKPKLIALIFSLIVLIGLGIWFINSSNSNTIPKIDRIGVLPFFNRINDPEQDPIVDGMHEALISELQQTGIVIKGRTSMMQYRNSDKAVQKIVQELAVEALIEGSVYRADDSLGLSIRLIDGVSGDLLWINTFESSFKNIQFLYHEVARELAQKIQHALSPEVLNRLKTYKPVNPEAQKAYFKGQQSWNNLSQGGLERALEYFELARTIDPEYAPAYAGIAAVWGGRMQQGIVSYDEATPIIIKSLNNAIALGEDLPEVQFWEGACRTWWLWDWERAEKAFQASLKLNPNYAEAHAYYSHYLLIHQRGEEALIHSKKSLELDPFNPLLQSLNGMAMNFSRKHDEVIDLLTKTLESFPQDPIAISTLRTSYHLAGRYEEAIGIWKKYYEIRRDSIALDVLAVGYEDGGYPLALERLAELMVLRSQTRYISSWQIATLYTRAGNKEKALEWLEKAFLQHDANMPYLAIDPIFDELKSEPAFQALLRKMGLKSIRWD